MGKESVSNRERHDKKELQFEGTEDDDRNDKHGGIIWLHDFSRILNYTFALARVEAQVLVESVT